MRTFTLMACTAIALTLFGLTGCTVNVVVTNSDVVESYHNADRAMQLLPEVYDDEE